MSAPAAIRTRAAPPDPPPERTPTLGHRVLGRRRTTLWWVVLGLVWLAGALYVWHFLRHGWVPHDEGALGQSAERVLRGELPHRDFGEIYTGGLSFLNAAALRVLGTNLFSLRLVLYAVYLLWVPAVYYVATRFAAPVAAGGVVLLGIAWSLPNYSAAMPSWYNLFLATFGVAAMCRYLETDRSRWLVAAGVAGGLSCLVKIVGLYYVAAVLLALLYREQCGARSSTEGASRRTWGYSTFVSAALVCFAVALLALMWRRLQRGELLHFIVPSAVLVMVLLWHEWRAPAGADVKRFRTLGASVGPFALGVLLPIALFLVPYVRADAVGALVQGVVVVPMRRFDAAALHPPSRALLWPAVAVLLLAGIIPITRVPFSRLTRTMIGIGLATAVLFSSRDVRTYWFIWRSMRTTVLLVALVGAWVLLRQHASLSRLHRERLMLLAAVTTLCALVQFPFAAAVYFFYVAPLVALAGLAIVSTRPRARMAGPAALCLVYLSFAVLRIHPGFIYNMGYFFARDAQTVRLPMDRGGIDVSAADAANYARLVALLREHASSEYAFASPDSPQVYFLSGLRNPTRTLFDVFDDPDGRTERVLRALAAHRVSVIALNQAPEFSGPVPPDLERALRARYPHSEQVGRFVVRWRE